MGPESDLQAAAGAGNLVAMNAAREAGAENFNRAAMCAAEKNQILALQELRRWGNLSRLDWAACSAARAGHVGIVQQCRDWGLSENIGHVLYAAVQGTGSPEIMNLCAQWGAPLEDIERSMWIAAARDDEAAVRWCHAHGACEYALAIDYARNAGKTQMISLLIELAPESLRASLTALATAPPPPPPAWLKP